MTTFWQKITTSKNLTIFGVLIILEALIGAAKALLDGDPTTNPNWSQVLEQVGTGVVAIMAKGQSNTGGVIPVTPEAAARDIKGQSL